ncbi:hypothetical protein ACFCYH_00980 [Streptomyces sp. NPDC056400]|uniref:hypothetical protein n=1 Tax=Streptomyces sp. NPDC056400 TaxID=3345808 RepID=UPI0035DB7699
MNRVYQNLVVARAASRPSCSVCPLYGPVGSAARIAAGRILRAAVGVLTEGLAVGGAP